MNVLKKRGQVMIFVVFALVLVGGVLLSLSLGDPADTDAFVPQDVDVELRGLHEFVRGCITQIGEEGLHEIGRQGGIYSLPSQVVEEGATYYVFEGVSYAPLREEVASALPVYLTYHLSTCLNDFEDFPTFDIEESNLVAVSEVRDDQVILEVYPLIVRKGDVSSKLSEFPDFVFSVPLGLFHQVALSVASDFLETGGVDLDYLSTFEEEHGVVIEIVHYPDETVLMFIEEQRRDEEEPYQFTFSLA